MKAGAEFNIKPFGIRAMDSMRIEKSYRLIPREMSIEYSALESGLERFVKLDKECDFVGKDALIARNTHPFHDRDSRLACNKAQAGASSTILLGVAIANLRRCRCNCRAPRVPQLVSQQALISLAPSIQSRPCFLLLSFLVTRSQPWPSSLLLQARPLAPAITQQGHCREDAAVERPFSSRKEKSHLSNTNESESTASQNAWVGSTGGTFLRTPTSDASSCFCLSGFACCFVGSASDFGVSSCKAVQ